jgi:acyl-[acyl-carrier-protein] desaturase
MSNHHPAHRDERMLAREAADSVASAYHDVTDPSLLEILPSLDPVIGELVKRHKETAAGINWSYHDFLPLEAYRASRKSERPLSPLAYTAVETALLTEVNLPWYTAALHHGLADSVSSVQEFVLAWTSEEDQHSTLLETYLLLTNNGDHGERSRRRKAVLAAGWPHNLEGPFEAMVYTAVQEMATRAFYVCAAAACHGDDPNLSRALRRIAKDETLHMAFYRDVVRAHLEADPNYVLPLANVLISFQMPGYVMPDFAERTTYLSRNGVFGPEHYYEQVISVLWSYWALDKLEPRMPEAKAAKRRLLRYRTVLQKVAKRVNKAAATGHGTAQTVHLARND